MSDGHDWCQDVSRDEAVRAAEDAAAVPAIQHRDLPEQVALLWASLGDIIGRVVRLEGEMDAGQDEEAAPAEGMRKERGESVRVVEEVDAASDEAVAHGATLNALGEARESLAAANRGIARLTAERDAAIRERDEAREECERLLTMCAASPRGWLTAEEREAIRDIAASHDGWSNDDQPLKVIDALLARETPPRVKMPPWHFHHDEDDAELNQSARDKEWIAAIRAAGGEVE